MLSIKADGIDFENTKVRFIGKNNKEAVLPLTEPALEAFKTYLKRRKDKSDAMWINRDGEEASLSVYNYDVRNWRKKLGIHFSSHDFRRAMASHCVANGMNPYILAEKVLRHEDIKTLSRYIGVSIEDLRGTLEWVTV